MDIHDKSGDALVGELQEIRRSYAALQVNYNNLLEAKKQEDVLVQQTKQNYEAFFNSINDFLFVLDEQGAIIHTNKTVIDRLGYTKEELSGMSVLMVHPSERREEAGRIVGQMLEGTAEFCPVPIETKSGMQIPVETRVVHGMWDGKPVIFGVTKDISAVKLSEEKFSKVFFLNPSACGLSDIATGKYVEVNDRFYSLLEFKKEDVIGKTAIELGLLTAESYQNILVNADYDGKISNAKADLVTKSGEIKHVLLSSENIYIQDKKYRFTVVHDITDLKKAEDEVRLKNEELTKSNMEKDKFFSIISHDLRSPFTAFLGLTEILAVDLPNLSMSQIQDFAVKIRKSATNLFRLLNNLLEWSQIQRGSIGFTPKELNINELMDDCMSLSIESAKIKEIELDINIPENLEIIGDRDMLQTVVRNLVSNAIKFTPKGGKVAVSAEKKPDDSIEIAIIDTGIGMNQAAIGELFRIDVKANRKGTEGELGTGLGLLLCKEFVDKHNGTIAVESTEGVGTTFSINLPPLSMKE